MSKENEIELMSYTEDGQRWLQCKSCYEYKNQIARVFTEATNEDEWTDEYREFYKDAQKQYRQNKCFIIIESKTCQ